VFKSTGDLEETFGRRLSVYEERAIIQGMNPPSTEGFAPGFCFPRRFLANYGYSFCVDDRGNQRVCLVTCDGRVLAALDARQTQVTRYSDDASLKGISGVPIARLRLQLLEVVDWNGVLWQSVPASRFSEVNSSLVQVSGKSQLLVYYYNWTTQNLIKYALVLSIGTLGAGGIDRNSS
jgi:hypothetical protein